MKTVLYIIVVLVAIVSNISLGMLKEDIPYASLVNSAIILTLLGFYYFAY